MLIIIHTTNLSYHNLQKINWFLSESRLDFDSSLNMDLSANQGL